MHEEREKGQAGEGGRAGGAGVGVRWSAVLLLSGWGYKVRDPRGWSTGEQVIHFISIYVTLTIRFILDKEHH